MTVPDGVFVDDGDALAFAMLPVPTSRDVLAILDRIARQRQRDRVVARGTSARTFARSLAAGPKIPL